MRRLDSVAKHLEPFDVLCTHGVGMDASSMVRLGVGRCFDLPGHGTQARADARYSPQCGRDALAREAGTVGRLVLVGHSLGAYLSLRFALQHKERVAGVCAIAGGPGFRKPEAMARWNESYSAKPEFALAHHDDSFVLDNLSSLACPLLIIVGEKDVDFLPAANLMKAKVPRAELVVIAGGGHLLPLIHTEQVASLIKAWLEKIAKT